MIQLNIAVLDEEQKYLEQLQAYLIQKREMFFKVRTFVSAASFLACGERDDFHAVVMTYPFLHEVEGYTANAKLILLNDGRIPKSAAQISNLDKYQSAEKLFKKISALLWQEEMSGEDYLMGEETGLIGIYSPVQYENQMLFSLTMAQILGEHQKVLYVNLLEHSGFYTLTGIQAEEDVGDLLYGMMERNHEFATGLHRIRQTYLNFDYIPPAVNPEHLSEITRPLYEQLFLALKNQSGYDVVVIDFGTVFLGFAEMIPILNSLYCLGREGVLNRYRMKEFQDYLDKESENAGAHIRNLLLPELLVRPEERNPMESSLYGGMGDYIRRYLYGGIENG